MSSTRDTMDTSGFHTPQPDYSQRPFRLPDDRFTQSDAILITYGDLIQETGRLPLDCLAELASRHLKGVFNTLHSALLPLFFRPWLCGGRF